MVVQRRRPSGFITPCQPSKVSRPPTGELWVHEIKHDGYRLMVRRDGSRVRCFNRRPIQFVEHLTGNGPTVFDHVCRMGLEGHRVEAGRRALSQRAVEGVAQVEESGERSGAPGARGGVGTRPAHGHQMHELGSIDVMPATRRSTSLVT